MNQPTDMNSTPIPSPNPTTQEFPKPHNPYARMSQRRAIACTICAKAKTKCDKAVPSCSRCTAKGLQCEPRSTRRTSDNSYRKPTKHLVSPKRFPTTNSIPTLGTSPRSVPSSTGRQQLMRAVSGMDFHTAAKMAQQQPNSFNNFNMMGPLQGYTPQIIDECYSYSSSPEQNMTPFSQPMEKNGFLASTRSMTPQTPDSFAFNEPINVTDSFDYMTTQAWSDDGSIPIGLGFEGDMGGMLPGDMWATPEPETTTPMGMCDSPSTMNMWHPSMSVSPPQMPMGMPPHSKAVPALSISECSVEDFNSPNNVQEEWAHFQANAGQMMGKPNVSGAFMDDMKAFPKAPQPIWEDIIVPRAHAF